MTAPISFEQPMASQKNEQEEVTLEDLLRLKRAERPSEAFWGEFDRELHQRMLQTLVKKDPLHIQIMRGLTGRFAQSIGVAAAAATIALLVLRPAFVGVGLPEAELAQQEAELAVEATFQAQLLTEFDSTMVAGRDYGIKVISSDQAAGFTRDFAMDGYRLTHESSDYSSDSAASSFSFGSATGVASLVY